MLPHASCLVALTLTDRTERQTLFQTTGIPTAFQGERRSACLCRYAEPMLTMGLATRSHAHRPTALPCCHQPSSLPLRQLHPSIAIRDASSHCRKSLGRLSNLQWRHKHLPLSRPAQPLLSRPRLRHRRVPLAHPCKHHHPEYVVSTWRSLPHKRHCHWPQDCL